MSRIEQLIGEIEEYIDSCKFQPLSTTKILVNKEELEELLVELRLRIPDEIKKYQKIISNQDAILNDARAQADAILKDATQQTNELVNEHEIMQMAYTNANQIIEEAQQQAQAMILLPITAMSCPEVFLLRQRSLYRKKSSSNSSYSPSGCMRWMSSCAAMQVSPA